jgi:hypothetical protein
MMKYIAENQLAPKEHATVENGKVLKKWHRGKKPAAERRGEPKEMTRGDCGARKKLAAACRRVCSCATVTWQKKKLLRKIRTQENCRPCKELAAAGIRMTRCAKVARGREHGLQRQGKDDIAPRTWKGRKEENKRLKGPECKNGVRYQGLRQQFQGKPRIKDPRTRWQLHLKEERTTMNGIKGWSSGH